MRASITAFANIQNHVENAVELPNASHQMSSSSCLCFPRLCLLLIAAAFAFGACALAQPKPRVVVLTDISNEPDDEESLVRFLVYANEYDIEGLVATTSTWLRSGPREDLIRRQLDAYALVHPNLQKHAPGFPAADALRAVTHTGQPGYGMDAVGDGRSTPGSQHLIRVFDRDDERPLWVTVWGGANTLAQALRDIRATRSTAEVERIVRRLRVYSISDQDDAGPWLRREYPELFYIVSPSRPDHHDYFRSTWSGISGDRHYRNGPRHHFELVDNPWLEANVINHHGPLGALYPKLAYIMEGDTPSFLGLIGNGLGWTDSPAFGGWGGRYVLYQPLSETRPIWTNNDDSRDTVTAANGVTETTDPATVWRWRQHFQHDLAARMDWCIAGDFGQANHNPQPTLNGDRSKRVLALQAKPGDDVALSADGTTDPEGDDVRLTWWIYREAGTLEGATLSASTGASTFVRIPEVAKPGTVHVILEAEDTGTPSLFAYRRAVIEVTH